MEKAELVDTMKKFGLSEYEAKVYIALISLGPSRAGKLSAESDIPQSKIYDVLNSLSMKEAIEIYPGRPNEYKAVTPNVFLKTMLENRERDLVSLREKLKVLNNITTQKDSDVISGVWTFKGKDWIEFFDRVSEMLDRSKKYVYAVTRDYSRSSRLVDAAKLCIKRGIKLRVIGLEKLNDENFMKAKYYQTLGIDLRLFETKLHPRIVVSDGKEVLIRLDKDPNRKDQFRFDSLWSQDLSLTKVMDSYVKSVWEKAEPISFKQSAVKVANKV